MLFLSLFGFVLAGCASEHSADTTTEGTAATTETATTTTAADVPEPAPTPPSPPTTMSETVTDNSDSVEETIRVRVVVEETAFDATLVDTPTSRDFASLLPLTLTLSDYAGTEKVSDLPRPLTTEEAPGGMDPSIGDITYYAPWGNLAIFYRDFRYADGLIELGTLESGIDRLADLSDGSVITIERAADNP